MQTLLTLAYLLLVAQLPLSATGETGSCVWSEIQSDQRSQSPHQKTDSKPSGFAFQHQAESPAEVTNRVPQPQPPAEQEYEESNSATLESVIKQRGAHYITTGHLIEPGLPIPKRIFPFHLFW
jgi:hypothetical protein